MSQLSAGSNYRSRLSDGRKVWLEGEAVADVASHPAFKGTVDTVASLIDLQEAPETQDALTFVSPTSGKRVNSAFLVPSSKEDIRRRHEAFKVWSDATFGMMSRLSEYSRSLLTGWYASRSRLGGASDHFADKISRYFEQSRDLDLLSTTAFHDPQIDRSKGPSESSDPDAYLRIVKESEDGIWVSGAKMIATAAPYVDEVFIYPFHRRSDKDKLYATMFAVPVGTPGLHLVCREPFASEQAEEHPLSSRYDEMDAVLIFDEVFIPSERVFIKDDPEAIWNMRMDPAVVALSQHQTVVRLISKLEFVAALGHEIATTIGVAHHLHVQEKLGELLIQLNTVKALLAVSEEQAEPDAGTGVWLPATEPLATARNLGSRYYPRAISILQHISAGGLMQTPSTLAELNGPIGHLVQKYYRGASVDAKERTRLFKLAWDLIASPLGSRHELYEIFYSGDPVRTYAAQYTGYDKASLTDPVWKLIGNGEAVLR
ncbi:4-hydroxyphenylacetate 3-hydroxylase family protein [Paenibacillus beijingensis]|uniref:4-hydroxyphenylacetate 3-hydroxylase n=1 Tax=Paenibacillus beijingensis TaxID=1126833 RepID=A0A0D5NHB5_9BACL|nr:4-hydroxyphenylacetate 3-hydroxylase N-terminal domain-containing protein [Paenibacillus beijingensis]AJY74774.1 4-hydroxyphenylacetate 3-hydroxylase [Paenibacillus beijingensis]